MTFNMLFAHVSKYCTVYQLIYGSTCVNYIRMN